MILRLWGSVGIAISIISPKTAARSVIQFYPNHDRNEEHTKCHECLQKLLLLDRFIEAGDEDGLLACSQRW